MHSKGLNLILKRLVLIVSLMALLACQTLASLGPDPSTPAVSPEPAPEGTSTSEPIDDLDLPPYPAPKLLSHKPEVNEAQALDAPIELVFDQPMDQASVLDAFEIRPQVAGELVWADSRTLRFVPSTSLARGARYEVRVSERAQNIEGEALREPVIFDVQTMGFLEVADVYPQPGSQDVDPHGTVTVIFNRPVVPLTSLDAQEALPEVVTFVPAVRGTGEWLTTSIYRFQPEGGFSPATHYTGRLVSGLEDTTGAVMETGYTWTFTTLKPDILAWSPQDNAAHVAPGEVISITFNQPMDHASTEAAVRVGIYDRLVDGVFSWEGGQQSNAPETLIFTPDQPLPRNAAVQVTVARTAQARDSQVTLSDAFSWIFSTVRDPGILSTVPRDGDAEVDVFSDIEIVFASPMSREVLEEYLTIIPEPTRVYSYWYAADTELRLGFDVEPATDYRVTLSGDYPDQYGEPLGEPLSLRYTTGDLSPYAKLNTVGSIGTFNAYTDTVLYAHHRNVTRLDLALYALPLDTFMRLHGYGSYTYRRDFRPSSADLVRAWSISTAAPRNVTALRRIDMVDAAGQQLPPGLYYVELTAPEVVARYPEDAPDHMTFVRSSINLVFKQSNTASLVWATDLNSGATIPDLPVRFFVGTASDSDTPIAYGAGSTDADGLWMAETPEVQDLWSEAFAFVGDPGDADFAVAFNEWDSGITPWNFDLPSNYNSGLHTGYLYTDRPIYRPGQTVYFKGIVREDHDADYAVPTDMSRLDIVISDPQGRDLYHETLPVSEMGTFFDELTLGGEAPLGAYYIQVQGEQWDFYASTSFQVAEYRAPEFDVTVETDRDAYLNGEMINVVVQANYYFGGPVADAALQWNLLSGPYRFNYVCPIGESCPAYSWWDEDAEDDYGESYGSYGRLIAEGTTTTDARGRATFRVPADIADEITSRRFTIEANITDINDQVVSERTTTVVHKGEVYIGLAPERYVVQAGRAQEVDLLTVDWDSVAVGGIEAEVVVMERRWYSVREESEDGYAYWTWTSEDIPVYTTTATTNARGMASISFTPESSGSYRVRATAEDARGNKIQSSAYVWVWGGGAAVWRRESTNRIELIADRDHYEVGDTAEILVTSPYSGAVQALITIERGQILETEVRELSGNTELLRIPISEAHVPNVFVSVVLIQGATQAARLDDGANNGDRPDMSALASFRMGQVMLPVSTTSKALQITLTPDRDADAGEFYRPRETAIYDVLVTDSQGNPVEAELSLRLADLAVLALADETGPTLLERFWSQRGLGVRTSTALVVAMEPYNRELAPGVKGGGGGERADEGLIRTRFADTAFWDPVVMTDVDGRAKVEVTLPDNLTTWRMQARGLTLDTLVGRGEVDIRSTLDLLVRPVLPRFFVVDDEAEIATVVHNNTDEALQTAIGIVVEGLSVEGATEQTLEIPAGEQVRVAWPVKVLPGELATVRMEARAGAYFDGREDQLPVYHYATPEVVATAGRLSEPDLRQEVIQLPHEFDPTQGELTVEVDGSLTAATQDALTYLTTYPYECVEQTVSRFLPNVLTYQALVEMGLPHEALAARVQDEARLALQKLYNEQHYDGGWGWWLSDDSNPYLTAYVLQGMLEAYRAGLTVDRVVVDNAVSYLREELVSLSRQTSTWKANRLAYQLYVLGEYLNLMDAEAEGELNRAVRLFEQREQLDRYGQAILAVALGLLEPEEESRVSTLLSDLAGDIVISATGAHWEEAEPDTWNMNTDTRSTAIILWAMARHYPESDLLPNVVRWLMTVRREGYWSSTNTTAWSLMGLIAYMRATGELRGDYGYTVSLNGEVLLSGDVNAETIDESRQVQIEIADLLVDRGNRLMIEREVPSDDQSGEGQLYYTAHLRYFLPVEEVEPLDRGIIVERQYSLVDAPSASTPVQITGHEARVGDTIRVKLTLIAPTDLYYVTVEDPLPAGCEAVDVTLNTTSVVGEAPSVRNLTAEEEALWYRWYGWGWWWFSHSEIRDEKVVLFSSYLPRGTYEYSYVMRASLPGSFHVIPATAYEMYFPEVFGRSAGGKFTITLE